MQLRHSEYTFHKQPLLLVGFHGITSAFVIAIMTFTVFRLRISAEEFSTDAFLNHHILGNPLWLLSVWCNILHIVYFNTYIVIDILEICSEPDGYLRKLSNGLSNFASYVLFSVIFPVSSMVSLLFWTICFWKQELICPDSLYGLFTPLLNHVSHTIPPFACVLFMLLSNRSEPSKFQTLIGLSAFLFVYMAGQLYFKLKYGLWPYLFMERLTPFELIWLVSVLYFGSVCFLYLGYWINRKIKG